MFQFGGTKTKPVEVVNISRKTAHVSSTATYGNADG